jgi:hypothetical protein
LLSLSLSLSLSLTYTHTHTNTHTQIHTHAPLLRPSCVFLSLSLSHALLRAHGLTGFTSNVRRASASETFPNVRHRCALLSLFSAKSYRYSDSAALDTSSEHYNCHRGGNLAGVPVCVWGRTRTHILSFFKRPRPCAHTHRHERPGQPLRQNHFPGPLPHSRGVHLCICPAPQPPLLLVLLLSVTTGCVVSPDSRQVRERVCVQCVCR